MFNYLKFGFIAELAFTALNSNGHGHKFGIRASLDHIAVLKIKETSNKIYPEFYSFGLFYNISNKYYQKTVKDL